jgi:hypothetical protein
MQRIFKDLVIILVFSYGLLHMSYKYMLPDLANHDFRKYNEMVKTPFDLSAVEAPFVIRQVPTVVAYALKEAGIIYRSQQIAFQSSKYYHSDEDLRGFFALILSNYLALAVSLALIVSYIRRSGGGGQVFTVLALAVGYFMVPITVIAPLTHGYAWLACVLIAIGMFEHRMWLILLGAALSFFSRETVIVFFCPFAFACYAFNRDIRFYRNAGVVLLLFAISFYLTRRLLIPGHEEQLSVSRSTTTMLQYAFSGDFIFQTFLTQAAVAFLCYRLFRRSKQLFAAYMISVAVIIIICIVVLLAGVGRIIGESYPLLILLFLLPRSPLQRLAPAAIQQV